VDDQCDGVGTDGHPAGPTNGGGTARGVREKYVKMNGAAPDTAGAPTPMDAGCEIDGGY